MTRWPRQLHVFGETWLVKLVSQKELDSDWNSPVEGDYNSDKRTIRIWRGLKGHARWVTLWHEVFHICAQKSFGDSGLTTAVEEKLVSSLAVVWGEILSRNFQIGA